MGTDIELALREELLQCLYCGATNSAGSTACTSCGKPLGDTAKPDFTLQTD
jgi:hypothetical protein